MKFLVPFCSILVLCYGGQFANVSVTPSLSDDEISDITDTCCVHGQTFAQSVSEVKQCINAKVPDAIEPQETVYCLASLRSCCQKHFELKAECTAGLAYAPKKKCNVPKTDIGKNCCEECSIGTLTGESQGRENCGAPAGEFTSPVSALRTNAFHSCCIAAAEKPTTTEPPTTTITTTLKPVVTTPRKRCEKNTCSHLCHDDTGRIRCSCREGYRLQADKKSCIDINECAEAVDDLCTVEGTVCHNIPGSFKCVPVKKREVSASSKLGSSCPAGFKKNVENQVCDDINECKTNLAPCPSYLCENTIGGYKCAGIPGKPFLETPPGTNKDTPPVEAKIDNICPTGFRRGTHDDCIDIDECTENADDCQRLSQHCINTHGGFFCQDHVSKRCPPGFRVNKGTGICEDIDECEESSEVCQSSEVCVNMPGAYTCKSKISTLPKLAPRASPTCQEGTRARPGSQICEDIDECREGTHLCDQFQNCVNLYASHECQCKNGFELDQYGSCVDIDECALKLYNCFGGTYCLNTVGAYTCTRQPVSTSTPYEFEYYDSEEDNSKTTTETSGRVSLKPIVTSVQRARTESTPVTSRTISTTTTKGARSRNIHRTTSTTSAPATDVYTPVPEESSPDTTTPSPYKPAVPRHAIYKPEESKFRNYSRPYPNTPAIEKQENPEGTYVDFDPNQLLHCLNGYQKNAEGICVDNDRPEDNDKEPEIPKRTINNEPKLPDYTKPYKPATIEKQDNPDRRLYVHNDDLGDEKPKPADFDPNQLMHCLNGYEKNDEGICVDVNECERHQYLCSSTEICENRQGGYVCMCKNGYIRNATGWCESAPDIPHSVPYPPLPPPEEPPRPYWSRPVQPPVQPASSNCELGFLYDPVKRRCVDIDECAMNKARCAPDEECVNYEGGYRCICGRGCRHELTPSYVLPPRESTGPLSHLFTIGTDYGQRGPLKMRSTKVQSPTYGAYCPWGYKLVNKMCIDIDECAQNVSRCGPQQKCENFYGGHSCQCPQGYKQVGVNDCEDIDECLHGIRCPFNSVCENTVGSYRCACAAGFRNAPQNDKMCVDIDECADGTASCEQGCANGWGGYRCFCDKGFRLHTDNRTCVDVDECAEWTAVRLRGRLCGGQCVNERGSYRCACPAGYRLASDNRGCIDIDECENGEATCAHNSVDEVCQNTRGGYHCHTITCPPGYKLESRHRCSRIQRQCPVWDWNCVHQPASYSYNFITFVSNIYLPEGSVDLFTMHGPVWSDSTVNFEMRMVNVEAPPDVLPLDMSCFSMRPSKNSCVVSLQCSPAGPQVAELELTMSLSRRSQFAGSAVARLVVIVSQYDF